MSQLYFETIIPRPLKRGEWNRNNPWNIFDGPWTCIGGAGWVTQPWAGMNVFERSIRTNEDGNSEYYWRCVWDNFLKMWRSITDWEHSKLPVLPVLEEPKVGGFDKWMFPLIKIANFGPRSIMEDLVSVQPMAGPE